MSKNSRKMRNSEKSEISKNEEILISEISDLSSDLKSEESELSEISDQSSESEKSEISEESFTEEIQNILKEENIIIQNDQKSEKKNLRSFLKDLINQKKYTQKEILDLSSKEFPHLLKATISTILSDSKNAKYNKFDKLVIIVENIYQFSE